MKITRQNVSRMVIRLAAGAIGLALIYSSGPLSVNTLGWVGAGIALLVAYMLIVGGGRGRPENARLIDVRRAIDCFLGALAWVLVAAPWMRLQFGADTYAAVAITVLPVLPLVSVGTFLLIRTLVARRHSSPS